MGQHKLKVRFILFFSEGTPHEPLTDALAPVFDAIRTWCDLTLTPFAQYSKVTAGNQNELVLPLVLTGGSEDIFLRYGVLLPSPIYILYSGQHNSLAASLEIASYMSGGRLSSQIIYRLDQFSAQQADEFLRMQQTYLRLRKTRIAQIGGQATWLVASDLDQDRMTRLLGVQFEQIGMAALAGVFKKATALNEENQKRCQTLLSDCKGLENIEEASVTQAMRLYQALQEVLDYFQCNALSICCFDLIDLIQTSACLALALFNAQGIPAGCEGDMPAMMSLLLATSLTQKTGFMCNPADIDFETNTLQAVHCSAPLDMVSPYHLNTHFETGKSVAVQGTFNPEKPFTVVKWAGENLERFFVAQGVSVPAPFCKDRCRTQITLQLDRSLMDFHLKGMANHLIVVEGHYASLFSQWNNYLKYLRKD